MELRECAKGWSRGKVQREGRGHTKGAERRSGAWTTPAIGARGHSREDLVHDDLQLHLTVDVRGDGGGVGGRRQHDGRAEATQRHTRRAHVSRAQARVYASRRRGQLPSMGRGGGGDERRASGRAYKVKTESKAPKSNTRRFFWGGGGRHRVAGREHCTRSDGRKNIRALPSSPHLT